MNVEENYRIYAIRKITYDIYVMIVKLYCIWIPTL